MGNGRLAWSEVPGNRGCLWYSTTDLKTRELRLRILYARVVGGGCFVNRVWSLSGLFLSSLEFRSSCSCYFRRSRPRSSHQPTRYSHLVRSCAMGLCFSMEPPPKASAKTRRRPPPLQLAEPKTVLRRPPTPFLREPQAGRSVPNNPFH